MVIGILNVAKQFTSKIPRIGPRKEGLFTCYKLGANKYPLFTRRSFITVKE